MSDPRPAAEFLKDEQIISGLKALSKWKHIFGGPKEKIATTGLAARAEYIQQKREKIYTNAYDFIFMYYKEVEGGTAAYAAADRDFVDLIARYTMNPNQVMRLWQKSILWRKDDSAEPEAFGSVRLPPDYHLKTVLAAVEATAKDADVRIDTTEKEEVTWLWAGYLPSGKLVMLDGDPGLSKSMFALRLAVSIITGNPFINGSKPRSTGGVILLGAEDDLKDTIIPRLVAAGAPDNQKIPIFHIGVTGPDGSVFSLADTGGLLELEMKIRQIDAKLVIIDPLNAFLGDKVDSNNDQKIRQVLGPLSELANRTGAVIFCLRHVGKMSGSKAIYKGLGSIGYTAASRANFFAAAHPEKPGFFVVAASKFNLGPKPESLAYTLAFADVRGIKDRVPYVDTSEACVLTADQLASAPSENEKEGKLEDAEEFLMGLLADAPVAVNEVNQRADKQGIKPITLRRAKEKLKIEAEQEGRRWFWKKPEGAVWKAPFST